MVKNKVPKLYGTKQEIAESFGINLKTLGTDLTEMRRSGEFAGYVLRLSHKRVQISIKGYEAFLKWKARQYEEQNF